MEKFSTINNRSRLYDNVVVYSPDMVPMFKSSLKRVNWYLNHKENLAEVISADENGRPLQVRLTFVPKGTGHTQNGIEDPYFMGKKENICVVSGCDDWQTLSKHHVVPIMFRKHFPLEGKQYNCHDLVLISEELHYRYENRYANKLKDEIAVELGIMTQKEWEKDKHKKYNIVRIANTLLEHGTEIPVMEADALREKFEKETEMEAIEDNLRLFIESNTHADKPKTKHQRKQWYKRFHEKESDYGKYVMSHVQDLQAFVERWRQHFLDSMKPKFMPVGWDVKQVIFKKRGENKQR